MPIDQLLKKQGTIQSSILLYAFLIGLLYNIDTVAKARPAKKDWTFMVYMAADNDLRGFAARNIKQMAAIGSTLDINILVELHIRISGNQKITRLYYIEQDKIFHINADDPATQQMDSGDPATLISFCQWCIENYPARNYALIFWNHGTGILDPATGRIINPTELFTYNPAINKLELDRTIGFLEFIQYYNKVDRGICWDDTTGNYLTNQKLEDALKTIKNNYLNGKKLSIIGFDACLMSMLEVANMVKDYADVMVGSQEVELGQGWDYQKVLTPFLNGSLTTQKLAEHIVEVYRTTYNSITNDYTQSAVNLNKIHDLEENVDTVATLLLDCIKIQKNNSVKNAIRSSRDKQLCTHFDEPSYLDMAHLYTNFLANLSYFTFTDERNGAILLSSLSDALEQGLSLINETVFANVAGKNLRLAQGLSLYFPERRMHYSYPKTRFAETNNWPNFLTVYLAA